MEERTVNETIVYSGKIMQVNRDEVELCDGKHSYREIVHHNGGSCVVACNENDEIILVKQFRYALGKEIYEIPAGKLEKDEDPKVCAIRELEEETGNVTDDVELIAKINPTPGYSTETIYIYKAGKLTKSCQHLDEGEFLDIVTVPRKEALEMIKKGEITDAKTVIGILMFSASI